MPPRNRYRTWLIWYYFFILKRSWIFIIEISESLKSARESAGLSLEEVSKDLEIPELILTQIEEGNTGAFKDIFKLKSYINDYAKYLGFNPNEIMDEFNEFMFEKTSKIQMSEIEKAARETANMEANDKRVASPYTKSIPIQNNRQFVITILIVIILSVLAVVWSIKQITIGNTTTNLLEFFTK